MTQIRVTPSELRDAANRLQELADRVRQLGHEALDAAESAPSYDGQFGPQVESMGAEAQALTTKQADRLGALSDQLMNSSRPILSQWTGWQASTNSFTSGSPNSTSRQDRLARGLRFLLGLSSGTFDWASLVE
jgi:hypothetical protein